MIAELVMAWIVAIGIWYGVHVVRGRVATAFARTGNKAERPARQGLSSAARLHSNLDESAMRWTAVDDRQLERLLRDSAS